jgi:small-conductance mechanosensitive channel
VIFSGNSIITRVTEAEAKAANTTPRELSYIYLEKIQEFVKAYREKSPLEDPNTGIFSAFWFKQAWKTLSSLTMDEDRLSYRRAIAYTVIITLIFIGLLILIKKSSHKIAQLIIYQSEYNNTEIKLKGMTIFDAEQVSSILLEISKKVFALLQLLTIAAYTALLLSFFPWTRKLGSRIIEYSLLAFNGFLQSFIDYIPNLFVIGVIFLFSYYTIRVSKFIFSEIGKERILFRDFIQNGQNPPIDWFELGIMALALVMAAPYLPGFGSPAFQGVSLFIGVLFSLGSSTALSNAMAGIILIYTRAFQMGDRIEVEDTQGDVVEKSLLVTRILTDDNVIVTLPNSNLLSTNILNYNAPIRDRNIPVALTINVNFGYNVPWQVVAEAVKAASLNTPYILQDPPAKLLHLELGEFSVTYEIETYTHQPSKREDILSEMQKNLRDACNQLGIEILSPHYSSVRDGHQSTVPEKLLPKDHKNRGFQLHPLGNLFQIDMQWGGNNRARSKETRTSV